MALDITSKSVEGVADLVVSAPIKLGFIEAYENVTYETRLRLATDAFYQLRVAAREYELIKPFSDVAERILTLLDFRIGILDTTPQRRLILAATFDRAWEPYIRLIWNPLGTFLDVLFCNCEGYVTATDHSFAEFAAWVRANQVDSTIFYNTTPLTVSDQLYLQKLERLQRVGGAGGSDLDLAHTIADDPDTLAQAVRAAVSNAGGARQQDFLTMAIEALIVLYNLADYYPPDNLQGDGKYLLRAAKSLFDGWDTTCLNQLPQDVRNTQLEAFAWLENDAPAPPRPTPDPAFDRREVQAGVLSGFDRPGAPIKHGCLMLLGVTDAEAARGFINDHLGELSYEGDDGPKNDYKAYVNVAITKRGLDNLGVPCGIVDAFPKEFREGMDQRAGLIGDIHVNHPRRWPLPQRFLFQRFGPEPVAPSDDDPAIRPPVELSEIDIIIAFRTTEGLWDYCELPNDLMGLLAAAEADSHPLAKMLIDKIVLARDAGLWVLSLEPMRRLRADDPDGERMRDHFGFLDFVSQPHVAGDQGLPRDSVRLGELVLGYNNDRNDPPYPPDDPQTTDSLDFLRNGTFLVVRKLRQNVKGLMDFVGDPPGANPIVTGEDLLAKMTGRYRNGTPLAPNGTPGFNNFDFTTDPQGDLCPFQAHIRRANPRIPQTSTDPAGSTNVQPRIMRRGMSYGPDFTEGTADTPRGAMFMAYNASLAEQFEVIQRWINGGNSTGVASAQNDPLIGVPPTIGPRTFRFPAVDAGGASTVVRVDLPWDSTDAQRKPFVSVDWGIYAFVPSRTALTNIAASKPDPDDIGDPVHGEEIIRSIAQLNDQQATLAWKTYMEDFSTKDMSERGDTPDVWAAIRCNHQGAIRIPGAVLVASRKLIKQVYKDVSQKYSVQGQLERMRRSFGEIYVGFDPGSRYNYEATATNALLMTISQQDAFDIAHLAAEMVIAGIYAEAARLDAAHPGANYPAEIDLRADFITPCLAIICHTWFGLPDTLAPTSNAPRGTPPAPPPPFVNAGGWNWQSAAGRTPQCPGDFLAPSRYCFYPDPTDAIAAYGIVHGSRLKAIAAEYLAFIRPNPPGPPTTGTGLITAAMCVAIDDNDLVARNLIGIMIGALPPLEANLRSVLFDWIDQKTLWRYQQALLAYRDQSGAAKLGAWADQNLKSAMMAAMRKRPAPDLLWRTALSNDRLGEVDVTPGDVVILSVVSATLEQQNELNNHPSQKPAHDNVFDIFGGNRWSHSPPVHACPATPMAVGTMLGVLTALFEAGRIEALPGVLLARLTAPSLPSGAAIDYGALEASRMAELANRASSIADNWPRAR